MTHQFQYSVTAGAAGCFRDKSYDMRGVSEDIALAVYLDQRVLLAVDSGEIWEVDDTNVNRRTWIAKIGIGTSTMRAIAVLRLLDISKPVPDTFKLVARGIRDKVIVAVISYGQARRNLEVGRWISMGRIPRLTDPDPREVGDDQRDLVEDAPVDQVVGGENLLSSNDTALLCCVAPATLGIWRHRKQGPPWKKVGTRVWYRREEVERWIAETAEEHEGGPPPIAPIAPPIASIAPPIAPSQASSAPMHENRFEVAQPKGTVTLALADFVADGAIVVCGKRAYRVRAEDLGAVHV